MTQLQYRIARIKELTELKKSSEAYEKAVTETLDSEHSQDMSEEKPFPLTALERPKSLKGLSILEIRLAYKDGTLSEFERQWYESKRGGRHGLIGRWGWMGH